MKAPEDKAVGAIRNDWWPLEVMRLEGNKEVKSAQKLLEILATYRKAIEAEIAKRNGKIIKKEFRELKNNVSATIDRIQDNGNIIEIVEGTARATTMPREHIIIYGKIYLDEEKVRRAFEDIISLLKGKEEK